MISDLTESGQSEIVDRQSSIVNHDSIYFAVPAADHETFARLPDKVRQSTTTTLLLLQRIHNARSKSAEAKAIAFERAGQRGFSQESLLRKYYRFIRTRDWRDVLDRAMAGPSHWNFDGVGRRSCPAFLEFWKSTLRTQPARHRSRANSLIDIWRTGLRHLPVTGNQDPSQIDPGYDPWVAGVSGYPDGWSAANLNRCAPSNI
jgi:hypothetical protein